MFAKIKKWVDDIMEFDTLFGDYEEEEFTADVARKNYQEYLEDCKKKQENYKLELCDDIKKYSRKGILSMTTRHTHGIESFVTEDYLNDLKEYFDAKGFTTQILEWATGDMCLKISWGEKK